MANPQVPQVFGHRSLAHEVKSHPMISTIPFSAQSGESSHSPFLGEALLRKGVIEVVFSGLRTGHTAGLT